MSNEFYRESLKAKLNELQKRLEARGGRFGGFSFYPTDPGKKPTLDEVYEDAILMLEAYLDGKCTPLDLSELDKPVIPRK